MQNCPSPESFSATSISAIWLATTSSLAISWSRCSSSASPRAGQDREALRLDELAGLVEQRVQDAGLHRVGVLLDVDQRGIAALVAMPKLELVAAEGQARRRQRAVQRPAAIGWRASGR
jgi:hypothetical protein